MRVLIRARGIDVSEALREHCERRLAFALARLGTVHGVGVRLTDVNGPRGGDDLACVMIADVHPRQSIIVRAVSGDAYASIDLAAGKLAEAVMRMMDRARRDRVVLPLRAAQRARRLRSASGS